MYMILWWKDEDSYLSAVHNKNGSIKIFATLKEADAFANKHSHTDDLRVISIEGVR